MAALKYHRFRFQCASDHQMAQRLLLSLCLHALNPLPRASNGGLLIPNIRNTLLFNNLFCPL